MQLHAPHQLSAAATTTAPRVIASQTIDVFTKTLPTGGTIIRQTERELRLAGARDGIDVFASASDAIAAASMLSVGEKPGLAVMRWRGGFRLHDVHTSSRSWEAITTHSEQPPRTTVTKTSSVPFAAGNLRMDGNAANFNPAIILDAALVALVDGGRTFMAGTDTWAGKQLLVELGALPSA